jgi:hypothetical protein
MLSVERNRLFAFIILPLGLLLGSCSNDWTIQTPELGMSRQDVEQRFKGLEKTDLAWSFPSHEWGREGSWEVRFDEAGTVREATWYHKPDTKGMIYASYIHVLAKTMKSMGDGSNDQPTGDTYQVWKLKEGRYVLNLSSDSTKLYFQKLRPTNVMAAY